MSPFSRKKVYGGEIEDYRQLLEDVEELEAIRAYNAAKASGDEAVPLEQAFAEIENDVQ